MPKRSGGFHSGVYELGLLTFPSVAPGNITMIKFSTSNSEVCTVWQVEGHRGIKAEQLKAAVGHQCRYPASFPVQSRPCRLTASILEMSDIVSA